MRILQVQVQGHWLSPGPTPSFLRPPGSSKEPGQHSDLDLSIHSQAKLILVAHREGEMSDCGQHMCHSTQAEVRGQLETKSHHNALLPKLRDYVTLTGPVRASQILTTRVTSLARQGSALNPRTSGTGPLGLTPGPHSGDSPKNSTSAWMLPRPVLEPQLGSTLTWVANVDGLSLLSSYGVSSLQQPFQLVLGDGSHCDHQGAAETSSGGTRHCCLTSENVRGGEK